MSTIQEVDESQAAGVEVLSLVFRYLNAEELKTARIWNSTVNQIITNDPKLLWTKNVLRIQIDATKRNAKLTWVKFRLLRLITHYNCPNFHVVETNLLSSEALDFFQSSIRHQMKYLKLTRCQATSEILLHILACTSRNLEHLEIHDFSEVASSSLRNLFPKERRGPYLCNLRTMILGNRSEDLQSPIKFDEELPFLFLEKVLQKAVNLESISLLDWGSFSCLQFIKAMSSLPPGNLDNVQTFELSCLLEDDLDGKSQYHFLSELQWIHLPNLKRLTVYCDRPLGLVPTLSGPIVDELTKSLAILLEGANETLKVLELINVPVANEVFRIGMDSFPNLLKVDTKGTLITKLDRNGNAKLRHNIPFQQRAPGRASLEIDGNVESLEEKDMDYYEVPTYTRNEVYAILCGIIVAAILIHLATTSVFGSHVATMLQVFIFSVIVFIYHEGSGVKALWKAITR